MNSILCKVLWRVPQKKVVLVFQGYFTWSKINDAVGTGTVFCCRSDNNNFENLRFHFGVKNGPFDFQG